MGWLPNHCWLGGEEGGGRGAIWEEKEAAGVTLFLGEGEGGMQLSEGGEDACCGG